MEKYYAVMAIKTATAANKGFPGECRTMIYGKGDKLLLHEGDKSGWMDRNLLAPYWVREYGYKRPCDAKRNWSYNHTDIDKPAWKTEVSIVTLWVRKDNTVMLLP